MGIEVFYSWQSDRPRDVTRDLIKDALDAAAQKLNLQLEEPLRIDSDTGGVPGTPPIAATIFRKIDTAAVFVADVTFVAATSDEDDAKLLPNPNVLIELGYAAGRLGWERIILVSNAFFGPNERLPFDLRNHRWPTTFTLAVGAAAHEKARVRDQLTARLTEYISSALVADLTAAEDALAALDHYAIELMLWHSDSDEWAINMAFGSGAPASSLDLAVARLLQLRLARTIFGAEPSAFMRYSWTYLGKEVIRLLRERGAKPHVGRAR